MCSHLRDDVALIPSSKVVGVRENEPEKSHLQLHSG